MNGRVYDYNLGRFMSVDPLVQGFGNSQGLNPYSYIMNNPLAGTDPTGYAIEEETKDIKVSQTGSRIKKTVGTRTTSTVTDDATGAVTNVTSTTVMNDGSFAGSSVNFDNGKATSATVFKGGDGSSASATVDFGSQKNIAKNEGSGGQSDSTINLRSVSATDSDGNAYSWQAQQMWPGSAPSLEGAMRGAHNQGEGYDAWADAGGSRSFWQHPLVMMATWVGGEALGARIASGLFGVGATRNSGTVWESITATQSIRGGTLIPKSFELAVGSERFWVHPNATKHMVEFLTRNGLSHTSAVSNQAMLQSFQSSVRGAIQNGYQPGRMIQSGRWELMFGAGKAGDKLPVIKHALYK